MATHPCSTQRALLENISFLATIGADSIVAFFAVLANALFIYCICAKRLSRLDVNIRLILLNISVCSVLECSYLIARYLNVLIAKVRDDACELAMTTLQCQFVESINSLLRISLETSLAAISVDRAFATWLRESYAHRGAHRVLTGCMVFVWLHAVGLSIVQPLLNFTTHGNETTAPICLNEFAFSTRTLIPSLVYKTVVLIASVVLYIYVLFYNQHLLETVAINCAVLRLQGRFQVRRNLQALQMLLPSVLLYALMWIVSNVLKVTLLVTDENAEEHSSELAIRLLWAGKSLYGLLFVVHPMVCMTINSDLPFSFWCRTTCCERASSLLPRQERSSAPESLPLSERSGREGNINRMGGAQDTHFDLLETMWNA